MKRILYTSDSEAGQAGTDTSMFDTDYSQVDTSYPIIPDSIQDMEIVSVEIKEGTNDKGDTKGLVVRMKTTKDLVAAKTNEALPAGFVCQHRVSLIPTEKYPKTSIEKAIGGFVQSFVGVPAEAARLKDLDWYKGQVTQVKVTYSPEKDGFPERNNFRFIVAKKAAK